MLNKIHDFKIEADKFYTFNRNEIEAKMNIKRYLLSVIVVFIVFEGLKYVINTYLLRECYIELEEVWRKDISDKMGLMHFTDFILVLFLVWIYTRWSRRFNITSGAVYGFVTGIIMNTIVVLNQWIIYPLTDHLMVLWIIFGLIQYLFCGLLIGLIYKPQKKILQ